MATDSLIPAQGIVIELGFTETSFSEVVQLVKTLEGNVESLREQIDAGGGSPQPGQLTITGSPTTAAQVGDSYLFAPTTSGGTAPRSVSVQAGSLPPGLGIVANSVSGTLSAAGTYSGIVLRVSDAAGQHADLAPFTIVVSASSGGGGTPDTRPGWFSAPSDAASNGAADLITGRTRLANSANGGKAGSATLTTSGSSYAWFAVANAAMPTFRNDDSGLAGGFNAQGTFTDSNGTVWRLYRSTYPGSYTAAGVTLS